MTCNLEAFEFIVRYLKNNEIVDEENLLNEINHQNVLNIMVTADFLKLEDIYYMVWNRYFAIPGHSLLLSYDV